MSRFAQAEASYKRILGAVIQQQRPDYFTSPDYTSLRDTAARVFDRVDLVAETFLALVRGTKTGTELGHPGLEDALSIPSRVFDKPSSGALPSDLGKTLDDLISDTFYLGLLTHLLLQTFPTRSAVERVDPPSLIRSFAPNALVADRQLAGYDKANDKLPKTIFDAHYQTAVRPVLESQFKLGFWKMGKCDSHFRNLFFAGILLGLQFDLATKG